MKVASTTVMLIVVSIMFLLCTMPFNIYFLGYAYGAFLDDTPERLAVRYLFYAIGHILFCTNNSLNFFMYFVSGRKFRVAFLDTFLCVPPQKPPGEEPTSLSGTAMTVQNTPVTTTTLQ